MELLGCTNSKALVRFFSNSSTITRNNSLWYQEKFTVIPGLQGKEAEEAGCFLKLCKLFNKEQKCHPPEHMSCVWHSEIWVIMRKRDVCLEYNNRRYLNFLLKLLQYDPGKINKYGKCIVWFIQISGFEWYKNNLS